MSITNPCNKSINKLSSRNLHKSSSRENFTRRNIDPSTDNSETENTNTENSHEKLGKANSDPSVKDLQKKISLKNIDKNPKSIEKLKKPSRNKIQKIKEQLYKTPDKKYHTIRPNLGIGVSIRHLQNNLFTPKPTERKDHRSLIRKMTNKNHFIKIRAIYDQVCKTEEVPKTLKSDNDVPQNISEAAEPEIENRKETKIDNTNSFYNSAPIYKTQKKQLLRPNPSLRMLAVHDNNRPIAMQYNPNQPGIVTPTPVNRRYPIMAMPIPHIAPYAHPIQDVYIPANIRQFPEIMALHTNEVARSPQNEYVKYVPRMAIPIQPEAPYIPPIQNGYIQNSSCPPRIVVVSQNGQVYRPRNMNITVPFTQKTAPQTVAQQAPPQVTNNTDIQTESNSKTDKEIIRNRSSSTVHGTLQRGNPYRKVVKTLRPDIHRSKKVRSNSVASESSRESSFSGSEYRVQSNRKPLYKVLNLSPKNCKKPRLTIKGSSRKDFDEIFETISNLKSKIDPSLPSSATLLANKSRRYDGTNIFTAIKPEDIDNFTSNLIFGLYQLILSNRNIGKIKTRKFSESGIIRSIKEPLVYSVAKKGEKSKKEDELLFGINIPKFNSWFSSYPKKLRIALENDSLENLRLYVKRAFEETIKIFDRYKYVTINCLEMTNDQEQSLSKIIENNELTAESLVLFHPKRLKMILNAFKKNCTINELQIRNTILTHDTIQHLKELFIVKKIHLHSLVFKHCNCEHAGKVVSFVLKENDPLQKKSIFKSMLEMISNNLPPKIYNLEFRHCFSKAKFPLKAFLSTIKKHTSLKSISLSENIRQMKRYKIKELRAVLSNRRVRMIDLSYNGLAYEIVKQLIKMKNIKELNIVGNNVPERKKYKIIEKAFDRGIGIKIL